MFTVDPKITDLNVKEKSILKVLFSMNIHQVATPEMILEDARSYVLFFRESKGQISAYIALYLLATSRKLFYSCSSNPFPDESLESVEEEALAFAESLGAMLDEMDFSRIPVIEQERWLEEQEIFKTPVASPKQEEITEAAPTPVSSAPTADSTQKNSTAPTPVQTSTVVSQPQPQQPEQKTAQNIPTPQQTTPSSAPQQSQPATPLQSRTASAPQEEKQRSQQPASQTVKPTIVQAKPNRAQVVPHHTEQTPRAPKPASAQPQQQKPVAPAQSVKPVAVKPKEPIASDATPSATSVVSREREALARLLTSF